MSIPASIDSTRSHSTLREFHFQWRLMNAYERFEQFVVLALGLNIATVILMALVRAAALDGVLRATSVTC